MVEPSRTPMTSDGLVHHWAQGPRDLVRLNQERPQWEFRWYLETPDAIPGITSHELQAAIHWVLNYNPKAWSRASVVFSQVEAITEAHLVLRFTDTPPARWPNLTGFAGLYYHDDAIGKNVAQVTAQRAIFDHPPSFAYILGMELAGHGCFRMWDMYIIEHEPYPVGSMGGWAAALANEGYPTELEIECAKAWLRGEAVHVHDHPQFTVPGSEHHHG